MKRVLLIDDDSDFVFLLKKCLEKKNCIVKYVPARKEFPKIVKEFKPEVIIIDILQYDLLYSPPVAKLVSLTPVILMSGKTFKQVAETLPVDEIIDKPFELPVLEKKIQKLVY